MSDGYAVYEPGGAPEQRDSWQVMVEFANPTTGKPATKLQIVEQLHGTRAEALALAEQTAFSFEPPDPTFPGVRAVYADGDRFITVIDGAMSTFHFTTRAVQRIGAPGEVSDPPDQPAYSDADRRRDREDGAVL